MRTPTGRHRPGASTVLTVLARGVAAGAGGTGAMSAGAFLRRRRYARRHGVAPADVDVVLDYDDSEHVVIAASTLLRGVTGRAPSSPRGKRALFGLVHWGYGSVVGLGHAGLYRLIGREPEAGGVFFLGCQAMALTLFPVLGGTAVPWRWSRRLMVTSLVQHALYAAVTAGTAALLRRRRVVPR